MDHSYFWSDSFFEYQDTESDCAHSCLTMATTIYQNRIPKWWFRQICPPRAGGVSVLELKKMISETGLEAEAYQCDWEDLSELPLPAVLLMDKHFVLLTKKKNGQLIIADPALGISLYDSQRPPSDWSGIGITIEKNGPFEKKIYEPSIFSLIKFINFVKTPIALILISVIPALLYIGEGKLFEKISSGLISQNDLTSSKMFLVVILIEIFKELNSFINFKLLFESVRHFDLKASISFFNRMFTINFERLQNLNYGDLDQIYDELVVLRRFLIGSSLKILSSVITLFLLSKFAFDLHYNLVIYPLLIGASSLVFLLPLRKKVMLLGQSELVYREKFTTRIRDFFSSSDSVVRSHLHRSMTSVLNKHFIKQLQSSFLVAENTAMITSINGTFMILAESSVLFILYQLFSNRSLEASEVILGYWLGSGILANVISIIGTVVNFSRLRLTYGRLGLLYDFTAPLEESLTSKDDLQSIQGRTIELKDLSYSYLALNNILALKDINIKIEKPGLYAILGKSGSGKSTLGLLLAGLYSPTSGEILINGKSMSSTDLINNTSYVFQDEGIFQASLKSNIALDENPDFIKINECVHTAGLKDILEQKNLDVQKTRLDQLQFSEGQLQRIVLARALYRDRSILILDEGTHSLDSEAERKFFFELRSKNPDLIIFVITHRPTLLDLCNSAFVLRDGELIFQGPPDILKDKINAYL